MKHASEDIRKLAVSLYKSGNYTLQKVADIVGYHFKSVQNWLKADAEGRPQRPRKKGCPPRALSPADLEQLQKLIEEGKFRNLDELTKMFGKASRSVIHRAMRKMGYTYKKKRFLPAKGLKKKSSKKEKSGKTG